MADSMIERVARTMCLQRYKAEDRWDAVGRPDRWERIGPDLREYWRTLARTAIAAMRDLTETEMLAAGPCLIEASEHGNSAPVGEWWRAIIDAALKEPT